MIKFVFISKGKSDIDKWIAIAKNIINSLDCICKVVIITGKAIECSCNEDIRVVNAYAGYNSDRIFFDGSKLAEKLNQLSAYVSPTAYRADERYIFSTEKEENLVAEQIYITENVIRILKDIKPDYLFLAGAGTLIRTVCLAVARTLGIRAYRILSAHHWNVGRKGLRYFFCDNDFGDFSALGEEPFQYDKKAVAAYVEMFIEQLRFRTYRFDNYARETGRYWRISRPGFGIFFDVMKWIKHRISGDFLSAEKLRQKVIFKVRSKFTTFICDDVKQISGNFLVLPLNVPSDAQLRLRAREWTDSMALIRFLASNLPFGYQLVVKLHPGNPGMLPFSFCKKIKNEYSNVLFISHEESLIDIIEKSIAVIVINGSAALESAVLKRPCIYLGHSFFKHLPNCEEGIIPFKIESFLMELNEYKMDGVDKSSVNSILERYFSHTFPNVGEEAERKENSIDVISNAIVTMAISG